MTIEKCRTCEHAFTAGKEDRWLYCKKSLADKDDCGEYEMADEALKIAIKTLEQKPCEDAISRQAVLDELNKWDWQELYLPIHFKENIIDVVPSVNPQPKTGHWVRWYEIIEQERCTIHDPHCKCSECNRAYDPYIASLFNYCPNCGARMESEDKE